MQDLNPLIRRAQQGDADAYNIIVMRFQDMAVGYAYAILKDFHLAEDAAQEAFIGAFRDLPNLRAPEAFPSWFRRIVFKHCDRFTRGKHYETVQLDGVVIPSRESNPMEHLERQEIKIWVLNAINALPEEQRHVTALLYISEYTHAEIAAFLNMSPATVNNRLRAARKRLQKGILTMTKDTLREEAPSRSNQFASKIANMIRPSSLEDTAWTMICAAIEGDLQTIRQLVTKDPRLAQCKYNYTQPIQFAVREGHIEVVRFLLDHGADPAYRTYGLKDSLVTVATDRGHQAVVDMLEEAIQKKSDSFSTETESLAAKLIDAVSEQNYENVATILKNSQECVNLSNSDGTTPLHQAVKIGDFYLVRYLLDKGANVNAQGGSGFDSGRKPIHHAIYAGWRDRDKYETKAMLAGYLVARGAEYNILIASALGDTQRVQEFLETASSLANFRDTCDRVPISIAARRGHSEIVDLLLAHGADPNAPEPDAPRGKALLEAAFHGHPEMAKTLLEHGADPNANVDSTGTAIKHSKTYPDLYELMLKHGGQEGDTFGDAVYANDLEAVEQMLQENPDLAKDENGFWGEGIMSGIAQKGHMEMINLLMKYGATVPDVSKWGASYYFKHDHIAKHFLENGMSPNHKNWLGITLLHDFAASGNIEKAKLLLDFGADIHAKDTEYCTTPLGLASRQGQKEMVEFLLERGAKTNLPNDEPWATPLAWAEKKGLPEIAEILRKHGAKA